MKKGQGISLNVVIVAAIALLVLVILTVIFTGRIGVFSRESSGTVYCEQTLQGRCDAGLDFDDNPLPCEQDKTKVGTCDDGSFCCKTI